MLSLQRRPRLKSKTLAPAAEVRGQDKLKGGQFRHINALLYTETSDKSIARMKKDNHFDFAAKYHEGYADQQKKWPKHPLDVIIPWIESTLRNRTDVVIDLGCGDGRIARELRPHGRTIISVDFAPPPNAQLPPVRDTSEDYLTKGGFVASNAKDVSILPDGCAKAVVFSLSLMGTDWPHFLAEGYRLSSHGGYMIIAEISSRMKNPEKFVRVLEKNGLKLKKRVDLETYFAVFFFKVKKETEVETIEPSKKKRKTGSVPSTKLSLENAPTFDPSSISSSLLAPCSYKKKVC